MAASAESNREPWDKESTVLLAASIVGVLFVLLGLLYLYSSANSGRKRATATTTRDATSLLDSDEIRSDDPEVGSTTATSASSISAADREALQVR